MDSVLILTVQVPQCASILDANDLQPFESYLRDLLNAGGGCKSMPARLAIDHNVACSERSMRNWIATERAKPGEAHIHRKLRKRPSAANAITTISTPHSGR